MKNETQTIRELLDACYEGLNQISIASGTVSRTRHDGQAHSPYECNQSGAELILAAIKKAEDKFPHLAA